MNYFFTFFLLPMLPIAILLGCLWSGFAKLNLRRLTWLSLLASLLGIGIALPLSGQQALLGFNAVSLSLLVLFLISQWWKKGAWANGWHFLLVTLGIATWAQDPNIAALTNTDVINTAFILNVSALVLAVMFCIVVAGWVRILLRQCQQQQALGSLERWIITAVVMVSALPLTGDVLLNLMKLQAVALTKWRLSYVAKVDNFGAYLNYANSVILLVVISLFAWNVWLPRIHATKASTTPIEKRQKQALQQGAFRSLWVGVGLIVIAVAMQLYWDKIASQPPALSEAQEVTLNAQNEVQIPIQQVRDGKLHRFVWIASDGKAIRFFIINRSDKKLSLASVFDACLLCGDSGYVMDGDQLMCVGCGVRLFIPSVGKAGGCNPIPMEGWRQTATDVIIPRSSLVMGRNYFSTVKEIDVIDPVNGTKLTNKTAQYRYDYQDHTYFFSNEADQNKFRENPEQYLQKMHSQQGGQ